jgi:hypothetical protein
MHWLAQSSTVHFLPPTHTYGDYLGVCTCHTLPCALPRTLPHTLPHTAPRASPFIHCCVHCRTQPHTLLHTAAHCCTDGQPHTAAHTAARCCTHCRKPLRALPHTAAWWTDAAHCRTVLHWQTAEHYCRTHYCWTAGQPNISLILLKFRPKIS